VCRRRRRSRSRSCGGLGVPPAGPVGRYLRAFPGAARTVLAQLLCQELVKRKRSRTKITIHLLCPARQVGMRRRRLRALVPTPRYGTRASRRGRGAGPQFAARRRRSTRPSRTRNSWPRRWEDELPRLAGADRRGLGQIPKPNSLREKRRQRRLAKTQGYCVVV